MGIGILGRYRLAKAKNKKNTKLSSSERQILATKNAHIRLARGVFRNAGFKRFPKLADREFTLDGHITSDFDDIFLYENLVICLEYTISKPSNVGSHLKNKKIVYDQIAKKPIEILEIFAIKDSEFKSSIHENYDFSEIVVRTVYCSRYDFDQKFKEIINNVKYLDYAELRYFGSLAHSLKRSSLPELVDFLDIELDKLGSSGAISSYTDQKKFEATLLPESNSNFDTGYKVVTFYVDPETLLDQAYVLRRQGWRDSENIYQRMISQAKLEQIRKHLKAKKRVFVNNIIATLDEQTKILDSDGNTVDPKNITKTQMVYLQLPNRFNTIGLIDGQHRTYSYYVGSPDDPEIAKLRKRQNLLVTGIIYPKGKSSRDREAFEARLFLEINSTQTNAKSDLKQAINRIVDPFSDESIASSVIERLGRGNGPLGGHIMRHWFDADKLKTASIVSYGAKPLVKSSGTDSIFTIWDHPNKGKFGEHEDTTLLDEYIAFCTKSIDDFLIPFKKILPKSLTHKG